MSSPEQMKTVDTMGTGLQHLNPLYLGHLYPHTRTELYHSDIYSRDARDPSPLAVELLWVVAASLIAIFLASSLLIASIPQYVSRTNTSETLISIESLGRCPYRTRTKITPTSRTAKTKTIHRRTGAEPKASPGRHLAAAEVSKRKEPLRRAA